MYSRTNGVFTKYELALVSNCINIQLQGGYVKKNYMELLESFKGAGENKGKQLLDTLETFVLDAGMNSGKNGGIHGNPYEYGPVQTETNQRCAGCRDNGKSRNPGPDNRVGVKAPGEGCQLSGLCCKRKGDVHVF